MLKKESEIKKSFLFILSFITVLFFQTIDIRAQVSRDDAKKIVLEEILLERIGEVNVFIQFDDMEKNRELELPHGKVLKKPFVTSYTFFIDDLPFANWEHPCRYIFLDKETGEYEIIHNKIFPKNMEVFEKISEIEIKSSSKLFKSSTPSEIKSASPNPNLYAVLINGGFNSSMNEIRYWNDISAIYCTLTDVYGYLPENIFVHSTDGTTTNNYGSLNLDNSGGADIDYPAYKTNIISTFENLENILSSDDQLFVFVTDHGGRDLGNDEAYIYLWDNDLQTSDDDILSVTEFNQLLAPIETSEIIVFMEQCFSGGFIDNQNNITGEHRVVQTACEYVAYSYPEIHITNMAYDEFAYYWTAAIRGYYPGANPWETGYATGSFPFSSYFTNHPGDYNPDTNNDGLVQMGEAFDYANDLNSWSTEGYYNPSYTNYFEKPLEDRDIGFEEDLLSLVGVSGKVKNSQTVSGSFIVCDDITVDPNKTLTISSGTEMNFQNNSSLIVNGTLDVNGTSSNNVSFYFVESSNNGIVLSDIGTANVSYAIIENAYKGLSIDEAYANVSNTDFIDCDYGLYLYRTNYASGQPDITNCNIYKSSYDGSGVGIYCNYSSPIILNTEVYNYYTGIGVIYNSSPQLGHYTASGNNNIHNNYKNIHAISSSNPFLGTTNYGGYNTLRYYTNNNIIAQTNCNIYAENNYWGSTSSSTIANGLSISTGCSVDFEPFLSWNPNGNIALPPAQLTANQVPSTTTVSTDLKTVHSLILSDKLDEALTLCNSFIAESKESANTLYAIDLLWQIERKMKLQNGKENTDLFAQLRSNSKNELVAGYTNLIEAVGQKSDRITSLDIVLSNYGSSDIIEKGVLYSKILYYLNEEGNKEKAEGEYKLLKEKYPNAPITEAALFALNSGSMLKGENEFDNGSESNSDEITKTYELLGNYPNPFNPTTQISYQIPEDGFVNLIVYNTLGQVVSTLVNEYQTSGKYSAQFIGRNLTSGIYFYTIKVNDYFSTNKMLLLK